ncbi:hypothetical protein DAMA08_039770 [Martiniozyma asiatica (nom. inval.)]|nr:hypothetical protein DAMA08_039770 [Martiniozyma asiatica]
MPSQEKLQSKLRRSLAIDTAPPIIYDNIPILNNFHVSLLRDSERLSNNGARLKHLLRNTESYLERHHHNCNQTSVSELQHRIEVLDQHIRILESTIKYIPN